MLQFLEQLLYHLLRKYQCFKVEGIWGRGEMSNKLQFTRSKARFSASCCPRQVHLAHLPYGNSAFNGHRHLSLMPIMGENRNLSLTVF